MSAEQLPKELLELLRESTDRLEELCAVLDREYSALRDQDLDSLRETIARKQILAAELEDYERRRLVALDVHDLSVDELGAHRQHLEQLALRCDKQNRVNGVLLEKNRRRVQTVLAILQGTAAAELYNPTGTTVSTRCSQSLAQA